MSVVKLEKCRVCGNKELIDVFDLGEQELTGVFPKCKTEKLTSGTLNLVFCPKCGLLQLGNSFQLEEMYGDNYGYRSGLNPAMVRHLAFKINTLETTYGLKNGDVVLDIGSNDGTSLNAYQTKGIRRIGMDPTGKKFGKYYQEGVELITDFFSADSFRKICDKNVKIVTTMSMFYDLPSPVDFARQVEEIMADDGIWHLEQHYLPFVLHNNGYDTISHEHVEYYSLSVIQYIMDAAGLRILDVTTNDVNGGSFAVTVAKQASPYHSNTEIIEWYLAQEQAMELDKAETYLEFARRSAAHRSQLLDLLNRLNQAGKLVCGYGASTKGNTVLMYAGITEKQIKVIGEVNPDKFGAYTPGTLIPIEDEKQVKAMKPDYMLVLPWHFRSWILEKEQDYLKAGGHFIFPFPYIEIV